MKSALGPRGRFLRASQGTQRPHSPAMASPAADAAAAPEPPYVDVLAAAARDAIAAAAYTTTMASHTVNDLADRIVGLRKSYERELAARAAAAKGVPTHEKIRAITDLMERMRDISAQARDLRKVADEVLAGSMLSPVEPADEPAAAASCTLAPPYVALDGDRRMALLRRARNMAILVTGRALVVVDPSTCEVAIVRFVAEGKPASFHQDQLGEHGTTAVALHDPDDEAAVPTFAFVFKICASGETFVRAVGADGEMRDLLRGEPDAKPRIHCDVPGYLIVRHPRNRVEVIAVGSAAEGDAGSEAEGDAAAEMSGLRGPEGAGARFSECPAGEGGTAAPPAGSRAAAFRSVSFYGRAWGIIALDAYQPTADRLLVLWAGGPQRPNQITEHDIRKSHIPYRIFHTHLTTIGVIAQGCGAERGQGATGPASPPRPLITLMSKTGQLRFADAITMEVLHTREINDFFRTSHPPHKRTPSGFRVKIPFVGDRFVLRVWKDAEPEGRRHPPDCPSPKGEGQYPEEETPSEATVSAVVFSPDTRVPWTGTGDAAFVQSLRPNHTLTGVVVGRRVCPIWGLGDSVRIASLASGAEPLEIVRIT
jgi:hypothetical protein